MKKLICTHTSAHYEVARPIVYPIFKKYAKKVKADFIAVEDTLYNDDPAMDRFRIKHFFKDYDRILYLDSDLVIRADCPNLFDIVPENRFGAYDESSSFGFKATFAGYGEAPMKERIDHIIKLCKHRNITVPDILAGDIEKVSYFNAGVFVCSKRHKSLFDVNEVGTPPGVDIFEQTAINLALILGNVPVHHLPACFNQLTHNRMKDWLEASYIVHFAGVGSLNDRIPMMQAVLDHWKEIGY